MKLLQSIYEEAYEKNPDGEIVVPGRVAAEQRKEKETQARRQPQQRWNRFVDLFMKFVRSSDENRQAMDKVLDAEMMKRRKARKQEASQQKEKRKQAMSMGTRKKPTKFGIRTDLLKKAVGR